MENHRQRALEAKERWAAKQRAQGAKALDRPVAGRLPPGQKRVTGFPVLDLGIHPAFDPTTWRLELRGAIERPQVLDWAAFQALPQVEDTSDFHCVTTWSKFDCRWRGVAFTTIHELCGVRPEATHVWFEGHDGYTVNVPLPALLDDDVLIATHFEETPLTLEHGAPARVIIPKRYAWKGAKFLKAIEFMTADRLGYWEVRGYSNTADPFTNDRYSS